MKKELPKIEEVVDFTEQEDKLLELMLAAPNTDVSIAYLFQEVFRLRAQTRTSRDMQMRVGGVVSRTNNKLEDRKLGIVPGDLKRTYKLIELK